MKFVEHPTGPEQVVRGHAAEFAMHDHARIFKARCITVRAPYVNDVAGGSKPRRDQARIVADTAGLWWVLTGDHMPFRQDAPTAFESVTDQ